MKKERFWANLEACWKKGDMEQFWKLWDRNPEYIQEHFDKLHADLKDAHSPRRKQHDAWWSALHPKLTEILGEEWEKENRKGSL